MPLQQLTLDIGLTPESDFSHFHSGVNQQARKFLEESAQALVEMARLPAGAQTTLLPCYLWGSEGTGKTHLLKAIAILLQQNGLHVGWLDSKSPRMEFQERWSAILLDDVHLYNAARQKTAFKWFVNATHPATGYPRWIVAAGAMPATDLKTRDDLRSRLGWGLTWQLHPLSDDERKSVLQQQAKARGFLLSDDVAQYLLTHFARDLNNLTGLLARMDAYAMRTQRSISVPMLKAMLNHE